MAGQAVDGTLQVYGTIRIWAAIVLGALLVIGAVIAFVLSFTLDRDFKQVEGELKSIKCDSPTNTSKCTTQNNVQTCTTHATRTCTLTLDCAKCANTPVTLTQTYEEGQEPEKGAKLTLYQNEKTEEVRASVLTEGNRVGMRIASAVALVIGILLIVVNAMFRDNPNYKRLQGGIGVLNTVMGK